MALHKVLSVSRSALARNVLPFKKNTGEIVTRNAVIYTPPTVRISLVEKIILGTVMSASILFIPAWVVYHIPEYQGEKKQEE